MKPIYVVGHKNPDNDSIMAAVVYAALKNLHDDKNEYQACTLGPLPKESKAVLERFGMPEPMFLEKIEPAQEGEDPQRVILVDHNERSQAVDGLEHAEIVEILDHHRIADVQTAQPILFLNLPIGSTASIVTTRFEHYGQEITPAFAGCLLAAIMTDTVLLKSPTATPIDGRLASMLADIIGENYLDYGRWVFKSRGADEFGIDEIIGRDTKRFEFGGQAVYIGQFETVDCEPVLQDAPKLLEAMQAYIKEHDAATFVLLITDILREGSQVFAVGSTEIVEKGLGIEVCDEGTWVDGLLSRKKQVAGPLIAQGF